MIHWNLETNLLNNFGSPWHVKYQEYTWPSLAPPLSYLSLHGIRAIPHHGIETLGFPTKECRMAKIIVRLGVTKVVSRSGVWGMLAWVIWRLPETQNMKSNDHLRQVHIVSARLLKKRSLSLELLISMLSMIFAHCHQLTSKLFNSCNCHGGWNCQGKVLWLLVLKAFPTPTSSQNKSPSYMNSPRSEKTSEHLSATFAQHTNFRLFVVGFLLNPQPLLEPKKNKSLRKNNWRNSR